jgi:hypothetical protein
VNNSFEKHLSRRDEGKPFGQIESQLGAKNTFGPGAGAVAASRAVLENLV